MSLIEKVRGALDDRCVGHFVYADQHGDLTIAGDDRVSSPSHVVEQVLQGGRCELAPITEEQLVDWRKKWRTYS